MINGWTERNKNNKVGHNLNNWKAIWWYYQRTILQLNDCMYGRTTAHTVETNSATQSLDTRLNTVRHSTDLKTTMKTYRCDRKVYGRVRWVTKRKKHQSDTKKIKLFLILVKFSVFTFVLVLVPDNTLVIHLVCLDLLIIMTLVIRNAQWLCFFFFNHAHNHSFSAPF